MVQRKDGERGSGLGKKSGLHTKDIIKTPLEDLISWEQRAELDSAAFILFNCSNGASRGQRFRSTYKPLDAQWTRLTIRARTHSKQTNSRQRWPFTPQLWLWLFNSPAFYQHSTSPTRKWGGSTTDRDVYFYYFDLPTKHLLIFSTTTSTHEDV